MAYQHYKTNKQTSRTGLKVSSLQSLTPRKLSRLGTLWSTRTVPTPTQPKRTRGLPSKALARPNLREGEITERERERTLEGIERRLSFLSSCFSLSLSFCKREGGWNTWRGRGIGIESNSAKPSRRSQSEEDPVHWVWTSEWRWFSKDWRLECIPLVRGWLRPRPKTQ